MVACTGMDMVAGNLHVNFQWLYSVDIIPQQKGQRNSFSKKKLLPENMRCFFNLTRLLDLLYFNELRELMGFALVTSTCIDGQMCTFTGCLALVELTGLNLLTSVHFDDRSDKNHSTHKCAFC